MKLSHALYLALIIAVSCNTEGYHLERIGPDGGLGFMPIQLPAHGGKIYMDDFTPGASAEVAWPEGLTARHYDADSNIYHLEGRMTMPLGVMNISTDQGQYDVLLKRGNEAITHEFLYPSSEAGRNVYLIGTFNNWTRGQLRMAYDSARGGYIYTADLNPGHHQFKFTDNGVEVNDPSLEMLPNGFGGYNHPMEITRDVRPLAPFRTLDQGDGGGENFIRTSPLDSMQYVIAFWDANKLPDEWVLRQDDGTFKVWLPSDVSDARHHLHLYTYNSDQSGADVLVPFQGSSAIRDVSALDRSDWEASTLYFMMVDRFVDGNADNNAPLNIEGMHPLCDYLGGDVAGIEQRVQDGYFSEFGWNSIWLSPIGRNPQGDWGFWNKGGVTTTFSGYHGYWPTSAKLTDKRMGTEQEVKSLLSTAHDHDLNVLMDFVGNHVHLDHPAYIEHPEWATSLYLPDGSKNTEQWDAHRLTTWFDDHLPTLELRDPVVVEAMTDSAVTWIRDYGFDGLRHDATKHVSLLYWRTLTKKLKAELQEGQRLYQIGETYGSPGLIASYLGSGMMDAQFDFNFYDAAINFCADLGGDAEDMATTLESSLATYGHHHLMGNISGNQDRPRFISLADRQVSTDEDQKLAGYTRNIVDGDTIGYQRLALLHALNHAVPGIPVVYYGDEYGMPGANDPDNRRMMQFEGYSAAQQAMRDRTQEILNARNNELPLLFGSTEVHALSDDVIYIERQYLDGYVVIIINRGNSSFSMEHCMPQAQVIAGDVEFGASQLTLEPVSFVYLKKSRYDVH